MLIAPLVAASGHSTSAQSQVAKNTSISNESDCVSIEADKANSLDSTQVEKVASSNLGTDKSTSVLMSKATVENPQTIHIDKNESWVAEDDSLSMVEIPEHQLLAAVEFATVPGQANNFVKGLSTSQLEILRRIKTAKFQSSTQENSHTLIDTSTTQSSEATRYVPVARETQPRYKDVTVIDQSEPSQQAQQDPIGSSYPIPWDWILNTHEMVSSTGGSGVRYYRSVPVVSPDGKYAVYSRVQLEIKPELYNSRVSSVLFLEDRQTGKLRVVSSTSPNMDTLLNAKTASDANAEGTIGVLVPVSWSEKGERFLARKFEAVFNTSDASDRAVIWDRHSDRINTITPAHNENEHEKIAVLLGWSQAQPGDVLFRAGEMGEEQWPVLAVSNDGQTVIAKDVDRPVTFGNQAAQLWGTPPVAYR
ncbi:hypothetical protein QUB80_12400 [Chlorogloeopsis sp. ULAP01]|uniref:hypothetical protein n=1 Tax=Chlorogloeopsis sp. ULAP01 TaxID=3056483 RepID=UPI0025AA5BA1|nr:hypothetical protein [Chlorogloeopsis sp. ULAP01]MDM9381501.1 hypothetical protein [Chlorogloeopsis sp. ULAP01]